MTADWKGQRLTFKRVEPGSSLPVSEPQNGYILQCDSDLKELQAGDEYWLWPIAMRKGWGFEWLI